MKKRKAKKFGRPLAPAELAGDFTRGMVAAGLLSAVQDRWTVGTPPSRKVVRRALQGGIALAAGAATADNLRKRDYPGALAALALGTLGMLALETLLAFERSGIPDPIEETELG